MIQKLSLQLQNKTFIHDNGRTAYDVPAQFQDNFYAMKAICSVSALSLYKASDRLKDNEDIVFTACFSCESMEMGAIQYASDRLKTSKEFILKCFSEMAAIYQQNKDYRKSGFIELFDWIRYGLSETFSVEDLSDFLRVLAPNEAADAVRYYPDIFFENEDAVLELMKRLDRPIAEKLYRSKSKRLQSFERIRAMIDPEILKTVDEENKEVSAEEMQRKVINQISSKEITSFDCIPEMFLINQEVLSKAMECGWFDAGLESILSLTAAIKAAPDEWDARFESWEYEECKLYSMLPEHLKKDKEVAIALLALGCDETDLMLENIPSLVNSKRAMMAMVQVTAEERSRGGSGEVDDYLRRCPHCSDKDFMVFALDMNSENIELVDDELFNDRDFMERVDYPWAITKSSEEFQMKNLDLVEKSMAHLNQFGVHHDDWKDCISSNVWNDRSMVLKYLRNAKGWIRNRSILELLHDIDKAHPLLNDEEVVSLSIEARPSDLQYVHEDLRNDKSFILQFVREAKRILRYVPRNLMRQDYDTILQYVPRKMRYDYDIITAAIAKCDGNVIDCWNILKFDADVECLTTLLHQTKTKLQLHDVFMKVFLMGVSRDDQHTIHPSLRSPLPMLNKGAETSTKLKKMIASYAGVPIGQSFIEVKGAIAALQRFGF